MLKSSLITLITIFFTGFYINGCSQKPTAPIPPIITPVYEKVRDLKLDIPLVKDGKAVSSIASPSIYNKDAEILQSAIFKKTGIKVPIISDTDRRAATPLNGNLIILGNRSTSKVSNELYDRYYSLMDLKYPGAGGYSVRSLHNPYGNGYSAVLIGGSDSKGVSEGTAAFVDFLGTSTISSGNFSVGWTMLTKLAGGVKIPTTQKEMEIWEASKGYGSTGYFGWNSISKQMAMYYMTGNPFHAREFIRLSFPDAQALKEIDAVDGERIENKKDPLAGPYHYNSMMLILFWDLIEESPDFTESEGLRVLNAFARRLEHEGTHPFDKDTYTLNEVPDFVGSRHIQWCALPVYTLGRYFNKYYPSPMWAQCERAGKLAFASMHNHEWVESGANSTGIAPVLTYMILSGDMVPLQNGVLHKLLKRMEIQVTGLTPDQALNSAALDFLNKAAYLTGDGRWITYCQRTGLDTDIFRLGQSFWPGDNIKPGLPDGYFGKWTIYSMPEPKWKKRGNNYKLEESFINMSYRNTLDAKGDYIQVDGYNEAYSSPYHNFDIVELRLNGATVMKGMSNQLTASLDGMFKPYVPMDGALMHNDVIGGIAEVIGEIPDMAFTKWRRSLALRDEQYVLIADDITFKSYLKTASSDNLVRIETNWEMPGAEWESESRYLKINPAEKSDNIFELHSSEIMNVNPGKVTSMVWKGAGKEGQKRTFFHLIGQKTQGNNKELANIKLDDHASALSLPEAALAVSGKYNDMTGELILLSEKTLFGHALLTAKLGQTLLTSDNPLDIDWDFEKSILSLVNPKPVKLALALSSPTVIINGKSITGEKEAELYFYNLPAGRHEIIGANPSGQVRKSLSAELPGLLNLARERRAQQIKQDAMVTNEQIPVFSPVMKTEITGKPVEIVIIPSPQGDLICTASGSTISIIDSKGQMVRNMNTAGEIKVMHWWPESNLLLAGCLDEKVIAFDVQGQKRWEFTSVMDPEVYEAAKTYWFKSAHPGVSGISTAIFDEGKSRIFVGSACTLEILDEKGQLVKRLPVFWGQGRHFLVVDAPDGSKNLLIDRWTNDFIDMVIINSKKMKEVGRGYDEYPEGHTSIGGWDAMNRYDNFLTDLDGDGNREVVSAVNGLWNRLTIFTESGKPLYNAQFGPGVKDPRMNMRMVDIGDLDDDGKQEIVVAHYSGYLTVLDAKANKIRAISFPSPPTVVKIVKDAGKTWICVGCEDGTVTALDNLGNCLKEGKVNGRPIDMKVLLTPKGLLSVIVTDQGNVSGFQFNEPK